jgi:hypothetical protein
MFSTATGECQKMVALPGMRIRAHIHRTGEILACAVLPPSAWGYKLKRGPACVPVRVCVRALSMQHRGDGGKRAHGHDPGKTGLSTEK